jgi:adenine-specific DNA-methyltransferase
MKKGEAAQLLNDTFRAEFDINRYSKFVKELFNEIQINIQDKTPYIASQYKDYISEIQKIGEYGDNRKKKMEVLVVKLKRGSSRDRARTMQRNFVATWLSAMNQDAALVAFYGDDPEDWRFSFVKMEYGLTRDEAGKVKVAKELTPAKRYSFLVGINEPNHTCQSRFLNMVAEEKVNPSLDDIEQAFSIDSVTKEFFEKYKGLFLDLKASLDDVISKDAHVKTEFEEKGISTIDFAKKLLGQIVFIYFLQKKGWLGVDKDDNGIFKSWGLGPKNFLRELFEKKIIHYDNFFNDVLEPLFYEALSTERDEDYYSRFRCKIPFLNGGLFEPINDYNWTGTEIKIDNSVFSSIFDTFDRFNFTVKEDEPLEKEVAVDPEMLGKVFENLLEVKDRKSKGAFYTPREIVHYMCQQSIINYLETNSSVPREDVEKLILLGDFAIDQTIKTLEQKKKYSGKTYEIEEQKIIPKTIEENYGTIDKLLKEIKIIDPAVGSGAFPVGMMNEIVKARSILSIYFNPEEQKQRTNYSLKRETIENCLYGVDIEPSAVEITKLRFWLSLIVDELDMKNIKPLPNLDHKIMCGNSLLEEFEGKKLFDEKLLGEVKKDNSAEIQLLLEDLNKWHKIRGAYNRGEYKEKTIEEIKREIGKLERKIESIKSAPAKKYDDITLEDAAERKIRESQQKLAELKRLQKKFFNEQNRKAKKQLRDEIDRIEWELIETTLKEQNNEEAIQKLAQYKKNKVKPFFLWKLYFAEVFQRENPGFDVVIANPPYVGEKGNKEIFRPIANTEFGLRFYNAKMDIFYFFFHKAIDISRQHADITFISTNYYITATGAKTLRQDFKDRTDILRLINFNELKIFDSAKGQHNIITILKKGKNNRNAETCITTRTGVASQNILNNILSWKDDETTYFNLSQESIYDTEKNYIRLDASNKEQTTGNKEPTNRFSEILDKIKKNNSGLINYCNINSGCDITISRITKKHTDAFQGGFEQGQGVFVLNENEIKLLGLNSDEMPIIKNFIKNSDIFPFGMRFSKDKLIYLRWEDNIDKYPNIKRYLSKFKEILDDQANRYGEDYPWYALHRPREQEIFESEKILVPYRSKTNIFGYSLDSVYSSRDVFFITKKENHDLKYLLGILNSKLVYLWLYFRGKRKGDMLELYYAPLSEIPTKEIPSPKQNFLIQLVDQILSIAKDSDYLDNPDKRAKVKDMEKEIDQLVYKLYELTSDEIEIVEKFCKEKGR